jgi:hypothetical protein
MSEAGVQSWALVAEVDKVAPPQAPWLVQAPFSLHLEVVASIATIIPQVSSRQGLSHVG